MASDNLKTHTMRSLIDLFTPLLEVGMAARLPAQTLAAMLPDVVDVRLFTSALLKVQQGEDEQITLTEIRELARAFSSLIKLPDAAKFHVIQKMLPVYQPTSRAPTTATATGTVEPASQP